MASEEELSQDLVGDTEFAEKQSDRLQLVEQLFKRITQEIDASNPANVIYFIIEFLCKHYPEHLQGFASIFTGDPDLEFEKLTVVEFFRAQKIPTEVAAHFTNAGFDTLETLTTVNAETLDDIERFNSTNWLPGHKVRLQQTFANIASCIKLYRDEKENAVKQATGAHPFPVSNPPPFPVYRPALYNQNYATQVKVPLQLSAPAYRYPPPTSNVLPAQYISRGISDEAKKMY